ncbi:nidogen-like domain-containing protein [Ditylenchus destructor]|nr:nidogen-like domain-containing protein [Ditylenchus destructor]
MRFWIRIAALLLLLPCAFSNVQLSHFFNHGSDNGDTPLPRGCVSCADCAPYGDVNLTTPFPFFGQSFNSMYVNVIGTVSFADKISVFTPTCMPLPQAFSSIAPFWADVDTRTTGNVWYRQSTKEDELMKARKEVTKGFPEFTGLQLKWMLIVTWINVTYFPDVPTTIRENLEFVGSCSTKVAGKWSREYIEDLADRKRNTFQAVITTDGEHSFAIFFYNKVEWTTGDMSFGHDGLGGQPARAGFDLGDGQHYTMIHGSCSDNILETLPEKSNVGRPGTWVFRIDGDSIQSGFCASNNKKNSTKGGEGGGATKQGNGAHYEVLDTCNTTQPKPQEVLTTTPAFGDMLVPLKNMHGNVANVTTGNSAKNNSTNEAESEPENEKEIDPENEKETDPENEPENEKETDPENEPENEAESEPENEEKIDPENEPENEKEIDPENVDQYRITS